MSKNFHILNVLDLLLNANCCVHKNENGYILVTESGNPTSIKISMIIIDNLVENGILIYVDPNGNSFCKEDSWIVNREINNIMSGKEFLTEVSGCQEPCVCLGHSITMLDLGDRLLDIQLNFMVKIKAETYSIPLKKLKKR